MEERDEDGVPAFGSEHSDVQAGRFAPGWIQGRKGGRAEGAEKAEGKIKQTGTTSGRFEGKPLSAHCLGAPFPAPWFLPRRAGDSREALRLLDFDRHYSPETGGFSRSSGGARP
ncbi:hypothetical protein DNK03_00420 [Brucella anthropi]|nr:hypothetical protein DNK03_00420 [Brucella anthropi]